MSLFAQEYSTEFVIKFRINADVIDPKFQDNAQAIKSIKAFLEEIKHDSTIAVDGITLQGSASPEGNYEFNQKLAKGRLQAIKDLIHAHSDIPDSVITCNDDYIQWDSLRAFVLRSDIPHKDKVLSIIDEEETLVTLYGDKRIDARVQKLKKVNNGKAWKYMYRNYFSNMRSSCGIFFNCKQVLLPLVTGIDTVFPLPLAQDKPFVKEFVPVPMEQPRTWCPKMHIKTNSLFYAVIIPNIAVEFDFAKHWSITVPVYYSAMDYFVHDIKFRTLAVQPELRYWFSPENTKWFIGAHFNYAQFNIATNGDYRYQDHAGKAPALGGGLSFGYRMPLSKNKRWNVEFTAGLGVCPIHYDRFYNVPNGKLVDTHKTIYWGVDNLGVNFSYSIDLKKRRK